MVKHKIISSIFFVLFLIILTQTGVFQTKVFATELTLPKTIINPDFYLLYSIKRLFEKTIIITKLSRDSKVNYYRDLTLTRIAELKAIVDKNLLSEVEHTTERFSYQVGILSDYTAANKKEFPKKTEEIGNFLASLKSTLALLRDKYHANSAYWLLIQHNINSIDINLQKLK